MTPETTAHAAPRSETAATRTLPVTLAVWFFLAALLARLWRAAGLWLEAGADDGFVWLPLGLAADLLFAGLLVLLIQGLDVAVNVVVGRLTRGRRLPHVGLTAGAFLGLMHVAWLGLNLVSFTLTQAPITFQRARGDEGVKLDAHNLLRLEDVVPAILFAAAALLVIPLAVAAGRRLAPHLGARRVAMALAGATLAYGADAVWFRQENFGVADHAVFTLVSSFADGALDEDDADDKPVLAQDASRDLGQLLRPRASRQETAPPPRGRAEMKNVVVFFAEGIARKHTSLGGTNATPNLARRAAETGLELTRYHSPYHKSIAAIYSAVCSDWPPPNGQNVVEINGRVDCGELSDVLTQNGLRVGLFHGGDFGFYDKLMLLGMRGYEVMEDARAMSDPLVYDENEWGIDDRATVHHLLQWVDTLAPGDRFGALLIPITAHWPYWIPADVDPLKAPTSSKNQFLSAVHFIDAAFEELMQGLEARGLADDTAVIFLADHGETVGERPRASAGRRLAYEPSLHVPAVILAPGMWPGGAQSDRLVSHVDLVPTILDLLGFPPDARHHGTSILAPDREPQRLFIGASNGPKWVGFLDGDQKFVVNKTTGMREAYDLAVDPDERKNIVDELPPGEADRLEQDALAFVDAKLREIRSAPRKDDELDIEARFLEVAAVRVRRPAAGGGEEVVACAAPAGDPMGVRLCPGEGPGVFQGRKKVKSGGTHDCLVVQPPARGVLEIEVKDQPWLPFLTRLRVVQTKPLRPEGTEAVPVEAWSDGEMHGRRVTKTSGHVRMPFAYPREKLLVRIGGTGPSRRDLCVSLTERGWRNKALRPTTTTTPIAAPGPEALKATN